MSSSAFSLTLIEPRDGFVVTKGEPVIGGLHGASRHFFCPHCMSWLFTRPDAAPQIVNVRATLLDDASWFAPYMETWTSEKLAWAVTGAVRSFAALPAQDAFGGLIAEFQQHAGSQAAS